MFASRSTGFEYFFIPSVLAMVLKVSLLSDGLPSMRLKSPLRRRGVGISSVLPACFVMKKFFFLLLSMVNNPNLISMYFTISVNSPHSQKINWSKKLLMQQHLWISNDHLPTLKIGNIMKLKSENENFSETSPLCWSALNEQLIRFGKKTRHTRIGILSWDTTFLLEFWKVNF